VRISELASFQRRDLEKRVRSGHPLRAIRGFVNEALVARAMLLQAFRDLVQ